MNYHDVCFKAQAVGQTLNDADFFISYLVGSLLLSNIPIPSMYVFTYVYHKHQQNGGRYASPTDDIGKKNQSPGIYFTNLEHTGGKRQKIDDMPPGVPPKISAKSMPHPKRKSEVENTGIFYINNI